jgi:hypothetical protein
VWLHVRASMVASLPLAKWSAHGVGVQNCLPPGHALKRGLYRNIAMEICMRKSVSRETIDAGARPLRRAFEHLLHSFIVCAALTAPVAFETFAAEPQVVFTATTIVVSGVNKHSQVVFFASGLVPLGFESEEFRAAQVRSDDDGDGMVVLDLQRPIPLKSVWVIAELPGLSYKVVAPPGFPVNVAPAARRGTVRKGVSGKVDTVVTPHTAVSMLYLHPSGVASVLYAADGYATDTDGRSNGITSAATGGLTTLTRGEAVHKDLAPGGIVFIIDLTRMETSTLRIDAALLKDAK